MIYIDLPHKIKTYEGLPASYYSQRIRMDVHSHLISDKNRSELLRFGKKIGLKKEWLQKKGTYQEHFDLLGMDMYLKAIKAGAVFKSVKELVAIILKKKAEMLKESGEI